MELLESLLTHVPLSFHIYMALATLTVLGACGVAFSSNIVYAAFSLLATFAGVVGLFAFMSSDFLAIVQLTVYVGGILVLLLFAIMLTSRIDDVQNSNPSNNRIMGFSIMALVGLSMVAGVLSYDWPTKEPGPYESQTGVIGRAFLSDHLLNFEVAGLILLAALIAAVVVARKEVRELDPDERGEP